MKRRTFNIGLLGLMASGALTRTRPAMAQDAALPSLVTLVAPFAPGGGADQLAREFAHFAQSRAPGTTFVVENKPGANGAIAARHVARQQPDGATLLLGTSSTHALGPLIAKADPALIVKEFSPVTLLATTANVLAVASTSRWKTLDDFVADARGQALTYGTFGTGSSAHLYGLLLAQSTGARLSHVPYKGSSQAATDLLGGHIDAVFLTSSALEGLAREGKVRVLGVTGKTRTRVFPDARTFEEQRVAQLDFSGWFGLFAPAGTPAPRREAIAALAASLGKDAAASQRMTGQGYDWVGSSPQALQDSLLDTLAIYRKVLATRPDGLGG
ncbi:tripartite tricarboxylate transporter substrate binding protein [Bordetella bronchiseptica]|uniref:tripartite tricarboxylate transporter substrate binding protein n=1 Tax=Bordetella bronchiseptica TaxID=518 RepID=UPI000460AE65|nr:tripartite tricarboxylate transporter substrate binding protein [Bordetella bronchiseptica]KDD45054.1 tripartite tricarboxylate transporter family receptor [Bordetella bronchiseptica MBORD901]